jgi:hypothetical protein
MTTVLVGARVPSPAADFTIGTIRELPAILPAILARHGARRTEESGSDHRPSGK